MSSDQPTGARSPAAEQPAGAQAGAGVQTGAPDPGASGGEDDDASLVRIRGLALLDALEEHATGSREHADAVATYAFASAVEMRLERSRCELAREVARLHEVGRLFVPARLAARLREELEPAELAQVEQSPWAAAELARGAGLPEEACQWLLGTRERYDGLGPAGLRGDEIPLPSRITRAACAYHEVAQRSARSGPPLVRDEPRVLALSELNRSAGSVLDPRVVEVLSHVVARAAASTVS